MLARRTLSGALSASLGIAVVAIVLGGCTRGGEAPGGASGTAAVPVVVAPPSEDIIAYVSVASLDAALERSAEVAQKVQPQTKTPGAPPMTAAQLKAQFGGMLGDPQLTHFDASKPIVIALLKSAPNAPPMMPPVVALIPAKDGAPYGQQLSQMGMQTKQVEGVLAIAQSPDALAGAPKAKALYDKLASAKGSKTARLFLDAEALLAAYGGMIQGSLAQLGAQLESMGAATGQDQAAMRLTGTMLKLEAVAFLSLLGQSDSFQVDADWGGKGFDVDVLTTARPGSELGGFFKGSAALRAPDRSLLGKSGMMAMSFAYDPAGFDALMKRVLEDLKKDPDASSWITPDVAAIFTSTKDAWKGTGAMTIDFAGKSFTPRYEMKVTSAEKFMELLQKAMGLMTPESTLGKMYAGMGIEMSAALEKNVRQRSGVQVHRMKLAGKAGEAAGVNKAQAEAMAAMVQQELEIAVVGDRAVVSGTPSEVDRMVDAALAKDEGTPFQLEATKVFGAGRQVYVDYDIIALMKAMFTAMPASNPNEAAIRETLSKVSGGSPMIASAAFAGERCIFQMRFPLDIIEKVAKAAAEAENK